MSDLFQEHKKFVVSLIVGALVFLILYLIIGAMFSSDIRRLKLSIAKARGQQMDAIPLAKLRQAEQDKEKGLVALQDLSRRVDRVESVEVLLGENQPNPDLHYNKVKEAIRREELEALALRNVDVDQDLGAPDTFPTTRREFDWYLRGLGVVRQVLGMIRKIDNEVAEGGIARIDKIEIASPPKTRPAPGAPPPFLEEHRVLFNIVGHPKAVYAVLESCARPRDDGLYLAIQSSTVRSLDTPPGIGKVVRATDPLDFERVECRLELSATEVRLEGQVAKSGKGAP